MFKWLKRFIDFTNETFPCPTVIQMELFNARVRLIQEQYLREKKRQDPINRFKKAANLYCGKGVR